MQPERVILSQLQCWWGKKAGKLSQYIGGSSTSHNFLTFKPYGFTSRVSVLFYIMWKNSTLNVKHESSYSYCVLKDNHISCK